jgi:hypothetical protein
MASFPPPPTDWHSPAACIAVLLLSALYTYHTHHTLMLDCAQPLQELVAIQITGVLLVSLTLSAAKRAAEHRRQKHIAQLISAATTTAHPMLPAAAARRRQQLPLV